MAILPIITAPDPRLKVKSRRVGKIDDAARRLMDDMLETMYAAPGIGLAATQVDVHQRIVVIDISEERNQPLVLVNPEILSSDDREVSEEGCLSVPGVTESVERAGRIRVRALDLQGRPFEMDAEGLLAVCIQHELDHLEGKLFVDYLSELKRQRIRKKLTKSARRETADGPRSRIPVI
jgi:peptide deformylase